MRSTDPIRILHFAAAFAIVVGITLFYRRVLPVNATTVALTFLLAILAVSTVWGMAVSVAMSVAAMLAFNYFFLPPVGTFTDRRRRRIGWRCSLSSCCRGISPAAFPPARGRRQPTLPPASATSRSCTPSATAAGIAAT